MTIKSPRVQAIIQPIWQEISSLWAGAEFAFYDQSLDSEEQEMASEDFQRIALSDAHCAAEIRQFERCY
jgi:hypothetical protein